MRKLCGPLEGNRAVAIQLYQFKKEETFAGKEIAGLSKSSYGNS